MPNTIHANIVLGTYGDGGHLLSRAFSQLISENRGRKNGRLW